jgi:hypothetical protein
MTSVGICACASAADSNRTSSAFAIHRSEFRNESLLISISFRFGIGHTQNHARARRKGTRPAL